MHNGVYRVWYRGPNGRSAAILAFRDGDILGCDGSYASVGRYSVEEGQFVGQMTCTRLDSSNHPDAFPDLDAFTLYLDGRPGEDFATLHASVLGIAEFTLVCEFAKVSEL